MKTFSTRYSHREDSHASPGNRFGGSVTSTFASIASNKLRNASGKLRNASDKLRNASGKLKTASGKLREVGRRYQNSKSERIHGDVAYETDSRDLYQENRHKQNDSRDDFLTNEERVQELRDQSQYLREKAKYLQTLSVKSDDDFITSELADIHDNYNEQLKNMNMLIKEWEQLKFHSSFKDLSMNSTSSSDRIGEDTDVNPVNVVGREIV